MGPDSALTAPTILQQYPFDVYGVKPVRKVFQLETGAGLKSLKAVPYPLDELIFMHASTEYLFSQGFQKFARLNATREGLAFIQTHQGSYFVSEWVTGREADYNLDEDIQATVRTLAEMHQASRGMTGFPWSKFKSQLGLWPENFRRRASQLCEFKNEARNKRKKTGFDQLFLEEVDSFCTEAGKAEKVLADSPYWELVKMAVQGCCFCHHDIAHHNVIIQDGQAWLIDFDYCLLDLRIHDLTSLVIRNMKKHDWQLSKAERIISYYHSHTPLLPEELTVMLAMMLFPQDFWQAAWTYYREDIGRTLEESISRLERAIKLNRNRQEFLAGFTEFAKVRF